MSIQYVNQSESCSNLDHVRRQIMVSPKKVLVQTTWNFRLQKIAQAVHRNSKVWQLNDILCSVCAQGCAILRLGKIFWLFNGWTSEIFTNKNISLRCHINNDRSLISPKAFQIIFVPFSFSIHQIVCCQDCCSWGWFCHHHAPSAKHHPGTSGNISKVKEMSEFLDVNVCLQYFIISSRRWKSTETFPDFPKELFSLSFCFSRTPPKPVL